MDNLAGEAECDSQIQKELVTAGVSIINVGTSNREVPYTLEGRLGPYKFWRAWYYWVVEGLVPIEVAREIYRDPRGKPVRTVGYSGNYDPDEWVKISRKEYDKYFPHYEKGELPPDLRDLIGSDSVGQKSEEELTKVFLGTMEGLALQAFFINHYHIDTQDGLNFFVETIKKYGLDSNSELRSNEGGYRGAFGRKFGSLQDGAPDTERRHEGSW
jgi:hypothetical protein